MLKPSTVFNKYVVYFILFSNLLFVSIYFLYVKYLVFIPFLGIGLIAPVFTAVFFGFLIGVLFNQNNKKQALSYALEQQRIIKQISLLLHQNYSEEELMSKTIRLILGVSFAKTQSKGGVFLTNSHNRLVLKNHLNMNDCALNNYNSGGIKFEECACGLAAQKKQSVFISTTTGYDYCFKCFKKEDLGLYSVPIMYENNLLGLIIVYLDANHKKNPSEIDFLEAVANVLALVLRKFIVDQKMFRKEVELREKQNLVDGILGTTPDPLFLLDMETADFVYCNTAMNDIISKNPFFLKGYKKNGVNAFREQVHPDDLVVYDELNHALRSGKDLFLLKFRTKIYSDKYHWIEQTVKVFSRRNDGKVHQALVVVKDISDKIHAENRVKKLNIELSAQNRSIKKINAELDQFVYSVSHDLRAPLASMLGLVNLSKLGSNLEDLKDYMLKIGQSVEKLDGFIKDILDYSRNSRTEIEAKPIVLKDLFMEIIDNIKSINNPDIELDFYSDEPYVYNGDARRIRIIFNNIISNTIKYADYEKKQRFLKVRIKSSVKEGIIIVEDNGIGIEKASINKIFNMFYRGTDKSDGSGIGLYIVKEIIQKLNGSINIESEKGVGTKITIQIPHAKMPV
ncbi:MAG: ATP-binding protein [Cyclobacteriaceae bacterium]|nr:ATP-binding protein [Cyclobacteriaceae bacterium]